MRGLPILCYHKVGSASEEGRFLNIEPSVFSSHVRFFSRRGFGFVQAQEVGGWPSRAVCMTFDDAYQSALSNAAPALLDAGGTATFFAVSARVGGESQWDGERARPLADWATLMWAQDQGFEVGNHTASHPHLSTLEFEDQRYEIAQCHQTLEQAGLRPGSLCFPYGDFDGRTKLAAHAVGYRIGLALGKRSALPTDDLMALPRIVVAYSDRLPKLLYKLHIRPHLP